MLLTYFFNIGIGVIGFKISNEMAKMCDMLFTYNQKLLKK